MAHIFCYWFDHHFDDFIYFFIILKILISTTDLFNKVLELDVKKFIQHVLL